MIFGIILPCFIFHHNLQDGTGLKIQLLTCVNQKIFIDQMPVQENLVYNAFIYIYLIKENARISSVYKMELLLIEELVVGFKANCSLVEPGPIGGISSVGISRREKLYN